MKPKEARQSETFEQDEEKFAAQYAIDHNLETRAKAKPDSSNQTWLKLILDQVYCIGRVVKYRSNGGIGKAMTWNCSPTECSCGDQYRCGRFTLTVFTEGDVVPSTVGYCKHGNRVKLEEKAESGEEAALEVYEIAIVIGSDEGGGGEGGHGGGGGNAPEGVFLFHL